ncbi:MAG: ABC transporter permease [Bacteroidota bacterium]
MQTIIIIARKEFLDTLRDRRTLLIMIIIPLLLFPLILYTTARIQISQSQKKQAESLKIGLISQEENTDLRSFLEKQEDFQLILMDGEEDLQQYVREDSLDLGLIISPAFSLSMENFESGVLTLIYQSTDDDNKKEKIQAVFEAYSDSVLASRLENFRLDEQSITPLDVDEVDVATRQEVFGKMAGGFIPYMFIIFSFFGCMYPAIDLFTGEKERGTMETILTVPISRGQILTGKMIVIAVSGLISAGLSMLGLYLGIRLIDEIPEAFLQILDGIFQANTILLLLALVLPMAVFFAGILIPISSYARNFKEAQSIITPLNFLVIIPAAIGLMPGVELNWSTVFIPILNVALASKEIVAGTIKPVYFITVFFSLILLAAFTTILSANRFRNENNILRT